jgi:hypothetical protein
MLDRVHKISETEITVDDIHMLNLMAAMLKAAELNYLMWLDGKAA